jgi:carboxyl-terminal processing protease
MKAIIEKISLFLVIATLATSCAEELVGVRKANTPVNNFEHFWKTFDAKYGLFEVKKLNWQEVYEKYRPRVNSGTTDEELYTIFKEMISLLNDNHVNLYPTTGTLPVYPGGLVRTINGQFTIMKIQEDYDLAVTKKYVQDFQEHTGNISSGILNNKFGYLNIKGTDSKKQAEKAMKTVVARFKEMNGLVIDIRGMYGGSDVVMQLIAGHFASEKKLYMATRKRNGPRHSDFTEPEYWYVEAAGGEQFTKPIILLTSNFTQSAGETFALAMDELNNVKILGDTTAGSYSDNPTTEMHNGWMFSFSVGDFRAADGNSYEGIGTAPDVWMVNKKADLLADQDPVLLKAIELLQ